MAWCKRMHVRLYAYKKVKKGKEGRQSGGKWSYNRGEQMLSTGSWVFDKRICIAVRSVSALEAEFSVLYPTWASRVSGYTITWITFPKGVKISTMSGAVVISGTLLSYR